MNHALLGKWLWWVGEGLDGLWRQVLERKYGLLRDGWEVKDASTKSSALWKGILSVKDQFMKNINYHIRLEERILFWKDRWVGNKPLADRFPDLFSCAVDKESKAMTYVSRTGYKMPWSPILRRNLKDYEEL